MHLLGHKKAVKVGIHGRIKSLAGIPHRSLIRRSWNFAPAEYQAYQAARFKTIYDFARRRVPYYREHGQQYPDMVPDVATVQQMLWHLPSIEKGPVRTQTHLFSPSPPLPLTRYHLTSGTTGSRLHVPMTVSERGLSHAILEEWYRQIAGSRRPRTVQLGHFMRPEPGGSDLYWVDRLSGNAFLSIYALTPSNRSRIAEFFTEYQPTMIYGLASALHQLSLVFQGAEAPGKDHLVAVTTAEVLHPHQRADMENHLCRRVYDFYGSQEGQHLALECRHGRLHIHPLIGVIEIVDDQGDPVRAGEVGRVLVTGLAHRSFPLIRYELGDRAESTGFATDCPCGLQWPTIGAIDGRSEDLIRTRDGRGIPFLINSLMKFERGVFEAQIVQTNFETFTLNIVKNPADPVDFAALEQRLRMELKRRLGTDVTVSFNYPTEIPRGPGGKFKAAVVAFDR